MTSDLIPTNRPHRSTRVKDVVIAILSLSLCFSLAALVHETRQRQEYSKLYADQTLKLQTQQKANDQSIAEAAKAKIESDRALRRAQIAMKAGIEAQGIVFKLRNVPKRSLVESK